MTKVTKKSLTGLRYTYIVEFSTQVDGISVEELSDLNKKRAGLKPTKGNSGSLGGKE